MRTRWIIVSMVGILATCAPGKDAGGRGDGVPRTVYEGLQRVDEICREVAQIRGLPFKSNVVAEVQSVSDFTNYVCKDIQKQFGDAGPGGYIRGLVKIGALKESVDLTQMALDLLGEQAAAHYDPETKKYFLLATNVETSAAMDFISSHELCHALQDQHFDLHSFAEKDIEANMDNQDASFARIALVEGEATVVMTLWYAAAELGYEDTGPAEMVASLGLAMQGALTYDALLSIEGGGMEGLEQFGTPGDLRRYPRFFVEPMLAEYLQGATMVQRVKADGGWNAVSALYRNPPESSEQVLHPEKLLGRRDKPVDVRLPDLIKALNGWTLVEQDVMGEIGTRILLDLWQEEGAGRAQETSAAAAGWGGDRYYYFERAEGKGDLLVWQTVWDTEEDALEFSIAYRATQSTRFPKMRRVGRSGKDSKFRYQVWEVEPGRFLKLVRSGKTVGVVDTTDRSSLNVIWE